MAPIPKKTSFNLTSLKKTTLKGGAIGYLAQTGVEGKVLIIVVTNL